MLKHDTSTHTVTDSNYYLIVSRLVPYKKIDLAIEACNQLKLPLKIIGAGVEEKRLRLLAGPTVELLGSLTDQEVVAYYRQSKAFLFPGSEDFGLTMVEAMSFGKPVIAYKAGGATEIIQDGKSGLFFSSQTVKALKDAILVTDVKRWNHDEIIRHSEKFSFDIFAEEFEKQVATILA